MIYLPYFNKGRQNNNFSEHIMVLIQIIERKAH